MQRLCKVLTFVALLLSVFPFSAFSGPPERWDNQLQRPAAHDIDIWNGETIDLRPRFLSYSAPWQISTNATITLYWSTNRFATAPWATNGVVLAETGRVSVTWSPACESGASAYQYFVGVIEPSGVLYRASGTIRMHGSPGYQPSTAPLPVWDGWTNGYIYATYAALLASSNALALSTHGASNALALALQAEASRAQQAQAAATATAQAALAAGLLAGSNYTDRVVAALATNTAAALATNTAARALSSARLDQADTQAWVSVTSGTATLWRVEASTNFTTYLRCVNAGSQVFNGLYYADSSTLWISTTNPVVRVWRNGFNIWNLMVHPSTYYFSQIGDSLTNASWEKSLGNDPLPVFSFTNSYAITTNQYPLATTAALAAVSNLLVIASTNAIDPVARASAASKPSYTDATNIASTVVSAYAAPSFPVYDYGLRTNVVFVLSNSVLYLYER